MYTGTVSHYKGYTPTKTTVIGVTPNFQKFLSLKTAFPAKINHEKSVPRAAQVPRTRCDIWLFTTAIRSYYANISKLNLGRRRRFCANENNCAFFLRQRVRTNITRGQTICAQKYCAPKSTIRENGRRKVISKSNTHTHTHIHTIRMLFQVQTS